MFFVVVVLIILFIYFISSIKIICLMLNIVIFMQSANLIFIFIIIAMTIIISRHLSLEHCKECLFIILTSAYLFFHLFFKTKKLIHLLILFIYV